MTAAIGRFFGTEAGFWTTQAMTLAFSALYWLSPELSVWLLSVMAIELTAFVLREQSAAAEFAKGREAALQAKLDELVRAVPEADNRLIHSEPSDE